MQRPARRRQRRNPCARHTHACWPRHPCVSCDAAPGGAGRSTRGAGLCGAGDPLMHSCVCYLPPARPRFAYACCSRLSRCRRRRRRHPLPALPYPALPGALMRARRPPGGDAPGDADRLRGARHGSSSASPPAQGVRRRLFVALGRAGPGRAGLGQALAVSCLAPRESRRALRLPVGRGGGGGSLVATGAGDLHQSQIPARPSFAFYSSLL